MRVNQARRTWLPAIVLGLAAAASAPGMEIVFPFRAEGSFILTVTGEGWKQTVDYDAVIDGTLTATGKGQHGEDTVRLTLKRKVFNLTLTGTATDEILGSKTTEDFDLSFDYDLASGGHLEFDTVNGALTEILFDLATADSRPFGPYRIRVHPPGPYSNADLYCQPHGVWLFGPLFPVEAETNLPTARVNLCFKDTDIRIRTDSAASDDTFAIWKDLDTGKQCYTAVNAEGDAHLLLGSSGRYNVYGAVWHPTPWGSGADHFVHNFHSRVDEEDIVVTDGRPDVELIEIAYPRPLVLVHGWTSDRDCWKDAVPFLRHYTESQAPGRAPVSDNGPRHADPPRCSLTAPCGWHSAA